MDRQESEAEKRKVANMDHNERKMYRAALMEDLNNYSQKRDEYRRDFQNDMGNDKAIRLSHEYADDVRTVKDRISIVDEYL
jgi:hypothetical protein